MQRITQLWKSGIRGKLLIGCGGLLVLFFACLIIIMAVPSTPKATTTPTPVVANTATAAPKPTEAPAATNTPKPTEAPAATSTPKPTEAPAATSTPKPTEVPAATSTPGPTNTPKPTATPAPTYTPQPTTSPADTVRAAIEKALGSGNRKGVKRVSSVSMGSQPDPQIVIEWAINDNLTEGMIKSGAKRDVTDILKTVAQSGIKYGSVYARGTFSMQDKFGNTQETVVIEAKYTRATVDRINWSNFLSSNVYVIADEIWIHPAFRD